MWRIVTFCVLLSALAGCEARETFVLLPNDAGDGSIAVSGGGFAKTVEVAWNAVDVDRKGSRPRSALGLSHAAVARTFSAALDRQPLPPQTQILYFEAGTATLTDPSRDRMVDLVLAIFDRPLGDVSVVGHADRAGDHARNRELSRRRAESVRDILVGMGVDPEIVEVASHGENNPLVPTADNVPEPRNRRVEVTVR